MRINKPEQIAKVEAITTDAVEKASNSSEITKDSFSVKPDRKDLLGSSSKKAIPGDAKHATSNLVDIIALSKSDKFSEKIQQAKQKQAIEAAFKTVPRSGHIREFTIALSNALNKILSGESNESGYGYPIKGETHSYRGTPWRTGYFGTSKYYDASNKIKLDSDLDKYNSEHGTDYNGKKLDAVVWNYICQLPKAKLFGLTDWSGSSDFHPAIKFGKFIIHNCSGSSFDIFTTSKLQNSLFRVSDKPGPAKTS